MWYYTSRDVLREVLPFLRTHFIRLRSQAKDNKWCELHIHPGTSCEHVFENLPLAYMYSRTCAPWTPLSPCGTYLLLLWELRLHHSLLKLFLPPIRIRSEERSFTNDGKWYHLAFFWLTYYVAVLRTILPRRLRDGVTRVEAFHCGISIWNMGIGSDPKNPPFGNRGKQPVTCMHGKCQPPGSPDWP